MEKAINRLKRELRKRGLTDPEKYWLNQQSTDVFIMFKSKIGDMKVALLLYASEWIRHQSYEDTPEPPLHELVGKTCCFLLALSTNNWNLSFTDTGCPCLPEVPVDGFQDWKINRKESESAGKDSCGSVEEGHLKVITGCLKEP